MENKRVPFDLDTRRKYCSVRSRHNTAKLLQSLWRNPLKRHHTADQHIHLQMRETETVHAKYYNTQHGKDEASCTSSAALLAE